MFIWVRSRGDMSSQAVICLSGSGQGVICPARR